MQQIVIIRRYLLNLISLAYDEPASSCTKNVQIFYLQRIPLRMLLQRCFSTVYHGCPFTNYVIECIQTSPLSKVAHQPVRSFLVFCRRLPTWRKWKRLVAWHITWIKQVTSYQYLLPAHICFNLIFYSCCFYFLYWTRWCYYIALCLFSFTEAYWYEHELFLVLYSPFLSSFSVAGPAKVSRVAVE